MRGSLIGRFPMRHCMHFAGCKKGLTANDDTFDLHSNIMQLYIVDIRSIGNCMLHEVEAVAS